MNTKILKSFIKNKGLDHDTKACLLYLDWAVSKGEPCDPLTISTDMLVSEELAKEVCNVYFGEGNGLGRNRKIRRENNDQR